MGFDLFYGAGYPGQVVQVQVWLAKAQDWQGRRGPGGLSSSRVD